MRFFDPGGMDGITAAVTCLSIGGHVREYVMARRPTAKAIPDFGFERARLRAGIAFVAGIDEAGIGPWAGPVVAAAVRIEPGAIPAGLADSKTLGSARRQRCYDAILATAAVGVGVADVARIDRDNVLRASHWAMAEAVRALPRVPDLALIDGLHAPDVGCPAEAFVHGDARIASIAAASIIAKVTRDRIMADLAMLYPGYGFEHHMGYGTAMHRAAIARLGLTPIHRRSFKPVKAVLANAAAAGPTAVNPLPGVTGLD